MDPQAHMTQTGDMDSKSPLHRSLINDDELLQPESSSRKLCLIMVGLPARGKTFISHKLCRYLNWRGYNIKKFNVSDYFRSRKVSNDVSNFFDPNYIKGKP